MTGDVEWGENCIDRLKNANDTGLIDPNIMKVKVELWT